MLKGAAKTAMLNTAQIHPTAVTRLVPLRRKILTANVNPNSTLTSRTKLSVKICERCTSTSQSIFEI